MEEEPDFRTQMDQLGATLRDFAPALGAYRESLEESGFTRDEAILLCADYQRETFIPPEVE